MYAPYQHELVYLRESPGDFVVIAVDNRRDKVDLERISGIPVLAENVPFADVCPGRESAQPEYARTA